MVCAVCLTMFFLKNCPLVYFNINLYLKIYLVLVSYHICNNHIDIVKSNNNFRIMIVSGFNALTNILILGGNNKKNGEQYFISEFPELQSFKYWLLHAGSPSCQTEAIAILQRNGIAQHHAVCEDYAIGHISVLCWYYYAGILLIVCMSMSVKLTIGYHFICYCWLDFTYHRQ